MAGHEKVYVVCENKCFEEGMTKEQILDLTSKASNGIVDLTTGKTYKLRVLSRTEYNNLTSKDENTVYYIMDDEVIADIANVANVANKLETHILTDAIVDGVLTITETGLYACGVVANDENYSVMINISLNMDVYEGTLRVPFAYSFNFDGGFAGGEFSTPASLDVVTHELVYDHSTRRLTVNNGTLVACRLITEY